MERYVLLVQIIIVQCKCLVATRKGFESLIGFKICFNLNEAVCLSPWLASL